MIDQGRSTPAPFLSLTPSGTNDVIAWLVPSTSFVLQQRFDLGSTNWADVQMPPTLNFTNLHYQVAVSLSLDRQFYRLKQQ